MMVKITNVPRSIEARQRKGDKKRFEQNSGSKLNRKMKKSSRDSNVNKLVNRKESTQTKSNDCDFVIFCDENELVVKAVEKENDLKDQKKPDNNKMKGLSDRNASEQKKSDKKKKKGLCDRSSNLPQQQNVKSNQVQKTLTKIELNVQIEKSNIELIKETVEPINNLKIDEKSDDKILDKKTAIEKENDIQEQKNVDKIKVKALCDRNSNASQQQPEKLQQNVKANLIQETLAKIELNVQTEKSNIELIKEAVVPINNLTLDETLDDVTLNEQSTIENKENDPTLMSIDLSKDEDMEIQQDQYKDVCGDMCCREFSNEIYLYMLERELKFLPDPNYMSKQPEINVKMRAMLVDWLIDVGSEYELDNETVFLTICYIDQYLSSLTISLQNFQLLGTAALFIASKYEEIYPPELKDFIFVTDDAYTKLQMLSMEKVILKSLKFNVSPPTIHYFLKYFLTKLSLPKYVEYFAEYLCFLSLLHTDPFLSFSPSDVAISSIILALQTYSITDVVNLDEFKQLTKIHFCKDDEGKLSDAKAILIRQSCVNALYKLQKTASEDPQQAVYSKYSLPKYLSVANVEITDEVPLVENFFN